jgi:hypothetical protein
VSVADDGAVMLCPPDGARGWDGNPVEGGEGKDVYFGEGGRVVEGALRAAVDEA